MHYMWVSSTCVGGACAVIKVLQAVHKYHNA